MTHFHGALSGSHIHADGSVPNFVVECGLDLSDGADTLEGAAVVDVVVGLAGSDGVDALESGLAVALVADLTAEDGADTLEAGWLDDISADLAASDEEDAFSASTSSQPGFSLDKTDQGDTVQSVIAVLAQASLTASDASDTFAAAVVVGNLVDEAGRPSHRHGQWIVGAHVHDGGALGVLGSAVPDDSAPGASGAALLYNEVATYGLTGDEVAVRNVTVTEGYSLFVYDNTSFEISGPPGTAEITYEMVINGEVQAGTGTATVAFPVTVDALTLVDESDALESSLVRDLADAALDLADEEDQIVAFADLPIAADFELTDDADAFESSASLAETGSVLVAMDAIDGADTLSGTASVQVAMAVAANDGVDMLASVVGARVLAFVAANDEGDTLLARMFAGRELQPGGGRWKVTGPKPKKSADSDAATGSKSAGRRPYTATGLQETAS